MHVARALRLEKELCNQPQSVQQSRRKTEAECIHDVDHKWRALACSTAPRSPTPQVSIDALQSAPCILRVHGRIGQPRMQWQSRRLVGGRKRVESCWLLRQIVGCGQSKAARLRLTRGGLRQHETHDACNGVWLEAAAAAAALTFRRERVVARLK